MFRSANNLRWKIVTLLVAPITFVMTLDRAAMTIAAPTIQAEFGLSIVEMSLILTVYFWTYALGQVPVRGRSEAIAIFSVDPNGQGNTQ